MMGHDPFFSVIIPCFNRAGLLPGVIQSVLNQTFKSFEIIIVDDGSTDDTERVVKSISDDRIKYFYKRNEERSIARNFGAQKSTGKYISLLDSDDYFYPNHLQTAWEALKGMDFPEVLHTGFEVIREPGHRVLYQRNHFDESVNKKLIFENHLHGNSFLFRAEVLKELPFIHHREAILSEDWCLWLRIASRYKIHCVNTITNAVIEHENRSLNKLTPSIVENAIQLVLNELDKDEVFKNYYGKSFDQFKAENLCFVGLHHAIVGNDIEAWRYLKESIKIHSRILLSRRFLAVFRKVVLIKVRRALSKAN